MFAPLEALRPKQWTKNLLLFVGVIFSQHLADAAYLQRAFAGFLAFSLLSGSVYVLNDLMDVEADRQHPKKCRRPIASGRLPVPLAWGMLPVILAAVAAIAWWLGPAFMTVAGIYLASNLAYSFWLKHKVIIDVFLIANGFMLRAIAGVEIIRQIQPDTLLSPWLLVCTFFGALFLGVSKRRRELINAGSHASEQRAVLRRYTPELLEMMLTVSASTTLMSYALYTMWPSTVEKFGTDRLLYTVPFVAFGVFRYLFLVRVSETSEDPSAVLLTDRPIQATVALFLVTAVWVLYFAR
ncbi:MAG: decaprenyl-phosphate phosphoribosyltransferase [Candidatus Eisenbacteria bacterium]|uniref:Decaprenyl-phosphate phosphoribosyltransferase n=1 Tax=Eiseniibacteriota bacterium TaxID=2212470 RepID=A0A933SDB8_UNCEI|nr:decaprenyl-phosphate phosphoribosyltransferase [Candidatus Eisenbacteria bacterium]